MIICQNVWFFHGPLMKLTFFCEPIMKFTGFFSTILRQDFHFIQTSFRKFVGFFFLWLCNKICILFAISWQNLCFIYDHLMKFVFYAQSFDKIRIISAVIWDKIYFFQHLLIKICDNFLYSNFQELRTDFSWFSELNALKFLNHISSEYISPSQ